MGQRGSFPARFTALLVVALLGLPACGSKKKAAKKPPAKPASASASTAEPEPEGPHPAQAALEALVALPDDAPAAS
jgi:hypothetical protein